VLCRYFARSSASTEPLLNRRTDRLTGTTYTLAEPIVGGVGKVRINDANWRVRGPDLPSGTRVRIVGHEGAVLTVEKDES
jgi:membrane protein implicated in regulation of membrane protease activity